MSTCEMSLSKVTMKNSIIRQITVTTVLGVAALGAHAQSNVTVYGLLDLSAGQFQAPGAVSQNAVESGKMTTSYYGFKGTEDLGGGLAANFALEGFLRADNGGAGRFNGDTQFSRTASVGLNGGFGAVNFGRNTTSLFQHSLIFNAFGDSFGFSPTIRGYFTSGTTTGDTAWSDSIKYSSPKFGGASVTVHTALGEGDGGSNTGLSGQYSGGPVALGAAWQKVKKGLTTDDTTTWQMGGSYNAEVAKVFAQYGVVDNDTTGNRYKILGLGTAVPLGAGKVIAQWGQVSPDTGSKRTTISFGYDHSLSKRTDAYLVLMNDKIDGLATGNNYAVGVRHRF